MARKKKKMQDKVVWQNPNRAKRCASNKSTPKHAKPKPSAKSDKSWGWRLYERQKKLRRTYHYRGRTLARIVAACVSFASITVLAVYAADKQVELATDALPAVSMSAGQVSRIWATGVGREDVLVVEEFEPIKPESLKSMASEIEAIVEATPNPLLDEAENFILQSLCAPKEEGGAGLTKAGAAAVMACMTHESGLNPNALNSDDGGYGLIQWTDVGESRRKQALFDYCAERGMDASTLRGQLSFFGYELHESYSQENGYAYPVWETLTTSDSVSECLYMFFCHNVAGVNVKLSYTDSYAGHSSTQELYDRRAATANHYYEIL